MNSFLKGICTCAVLVVLSLMAFGIFNMVAGNYLIHNPFYGLLIILGFLLAVYAAVQVVKQIWSLAFIGLLFCLASCSPVKSNQQVVVSQDCGMSWSRINIGDAVPKAGLNTCYMKVIIPNYPMQGDSKFVSNLKDRVRASIHIDYDYSITDPIAFIKQAKYLGKSNVDADSNDAIGAQFETAENMVIDKRIKDTAKGLFINQDIVELDQSDLENELLAASNKVLSNFGVQLNFITLTFDLDTQTRQAIDVATAMKVYTSKGMAEVGSKVIIQKAGAAILTIEQPKPDISVEVK